MLEALIAMPGGSEALPFVRSFYGQPSRYVWEDDQGEGEEQGDALMPLLFSLGQHAALEAVRAHLLPRERLFAFLDDVCHHSWADLFRAQHLSRGVASASTRGRLTFGMPLVTGHLLSIGSHKLQTQRRGVEGIWSAHRRTIGSAFWALHWNIPITSKPSSEESWQNMRFSCRASHW